MTEDKHPQAENSPTLPDDQTRAAVPDRAAVSGQPPSAVAATSWIGEGRPLRAFLMAVVPMTAILWMMGRQFWCKCGSVSPWSWEIETMHNSQHLIDPYSFTHVLHGFLFFGVLWLFRGRWTPAQRLFIAMAVEACWEVLENSPIIIDRYRAATISLDYYGDSIANSIADVASCLIGYVIASKLKWQITAALFVITEVVLLITIRDSLMLNVIMLTFPSDVILQWQSGG